MLLNLCTTPLVAITAFLFAFCDFEIFPLPYPAITHKLVDVPEEKIPGPSLPLEGTLARNNILREHAVANLFAEQVHGSESVAIGPTETSVTLLDRFGYLWVADRASLGSQEGYLLRKEPETYIGPGRPLGFKYNAASGHLIVCDSLKGLLSVETGFKRFHILANRVSLNSAIDPGSIITYANDLDIASDGKVFFSDSLNISTALNRENYYDSFWSFLLSLVTGYCSGRLLSYDPATEETHVIANGFWSSNGVALSSDESFVAVAETNCFAIRRVWLKGPKAGTVDTLVESLPGFPDGLSRGSDGNFWIAIVGLRSPVVPLLKYKLFRFLLAWTPSAIRPKVPDPGLVIKVSPQGEILASLWDPTGERVRGISAVEEHMGRLWLGNLKGSGVSYLDLTHQQSR
ncbi:hypothetical protein CEUSTIGMA_g13033.t1 [Chlamydomonas eustigma]|uniref:Strictosidine synthase conserved region domain-containing protein n=1 Tax=Chlamydomonas eustigma TaxID=1157962 RepID=A0A250XRC6_9CHLO|nr:hypothetical protein CEUSTIGMA_g13033.t1 [Chlamydomonas eustigma]|eukprot:GAX85618.1 hypothetical protein CEUSTIGMA_g13033.t1 [Chlamydomonas eustigma]